MGAASSSEEDILLVVVKECVMDWEQWGQAGRAAVVMGRTAAGKNHTLSHAPLTLTHLSHGTHSHTSHALTLAPRIHLHSPFTRTQSHTPSLKRTHDLSLSLKCLIPPHLPT